MPHQPRAARGRSMELSGSAGSRAHLQRRATFGDRAAHATAARATTACWSLTTTALGADSRHARPRASSPQEAARPRRVGSCVGARNYRNFVAFVMAVTALAAFIGAVTVAHIVTATNDYVRAALPCAAAPLPCCSRLSDCALSTRTTLTAQHGVSASMMCSTRTRCAPVSLWMLAPTVSAPHAGLAGAGRVLHRHVDERYGPVHLPRGAGLARHDHERAGEGPARAATLPTPRPAGRCAAPTTARATRTIAAAGPTGRPSSSGSDHRGEAHSRLRCRLPLRARSPPLVTVAQPAAQHARADGRRREGAAGAAPARSGCTGGLTRLAQAPEP